VGTATMPAIGVSGHLHTSMGSGAVLPTGLEPTAFKRALTQPDPNLNGPAMDVVRLKSGVRLAAGRASLKRIVGVAEKVMAADPNGQGDTYALLSIQRPAEIVNYQSTGATPALLAIGLTAGALVALGLTLAASVRRRRRDLALLKTFGFTHGQLAAAVAWQASVVAVIGILVGVPVGIIVGRWLWIVFAKAINAVPSPSVSVGAVPPASVSDSVAAVIGAWAGEVTIASNGTPSRSSAACQETKSGSVLDVPSTSTFMSMRCAAAAEAGAIEATAEAAETIVINIANGSTFALLNIVLNLSLGLSCHP